MFTGGKLKDLVKTIGEDIILQVSFEGIPRPSITWSKNGGEIPKSDRITIEDEGTSSHVRITSATALDAGKYLVALKNEAGTIETFCNVAIYCK